VTTTEFYYLLLVIGSFGAFAVGMILATIQDKAWARRTGGHLGAASGHGETHAPARTPTARAA